MKVNSFFFDWENRTFKKTKNLFYFIFNVYTYSDSFTLNLLFSSTAYSESSAYSCVSCVAIMPCLSKGCAAFSSLPSLHHDIICLVKSCKFTLNVPSTLQHGRRSDYDASLSSAEPHFIHDCMLLKSVSPHFVLCVNLVILFIWIPWIP